jgi:hypothetical protein
MINFPLQGATLDALARGRPTAELADRIERTMRVHARPHLMPTFLDNHDVDRFLASGSEAALRQGLLLLMTLPGIPTIYYGTEQGFAQPRASMFAAGWGSGGRSHFDPSSPGYRYLQRVSALRRGERVLSRGVPTILHRNAAGPGALAWRMEHEGREVLVALNTAEHPVLVDALDLGAGRHATALFAIDGEAPALQAGADGRVALVLPPRAGYVWRLETAAHAPAAPDSAAAPAIEQLPARIAGPLDLRGRAAPGARLRLVLDGDIASATEVAAGRDGRWSARLRTDDLVDPAIEHRVVAWDAASGRASAARTFHAVRDWRLAARVDDPTGDDAGADGRLAYPTDPSWGAHRQLDIEAAEAYVSGGALRLDLRMRGLTRTWNPANGFDHVALTVYVELPEGGPGLDVLPLQQSTLPAGMRWHRRLRVGGWSNVLTTADGAGAAHEGRPVAPGAQLRVEADARTVRLMLPAAALGRPRTLHGARVYVTTWDFDAGYRPITPQPGSHTFGGDPAAPRVMDDALLVLD